MTQVNAPYSLTKIRPDKELTVGMNGYLAVLERILQQLYLRSGGSSGGTEADETIATNNAEIYEILSQLEALTAENSNKGELVDYSVSGAGRTTGGDEFLRVSATCTIILNPYPDDGETVKVQPIAEATVTVSGAINGDASVIIDNPYDMAVFVYSLEAGEWVIT